MNVIVLGTTPFTAECICSFIESGWEVKCIVSLPKDKCPANSINLKELAVKNNILYYETDDINSTETEKYLLQFDIDYIFSTWPYIIKQNILQIPKYFVIGSHPTQLPYNRGRHPLHWLITLGIESSYISLFIMDDGIDSGDILIQKYFSCKYAYGIDDVYREMISATKAAIKKLCTKLERNPNAEGEKEKQNLEEVNYWRKKDIFDMIIDFRMSAIDIVRLVKSFNRPYDCAILLFKENLLRIEDAEIYETEMEIEKLRRLEPGRIINVERKTILVKASDKIVKLYFKDELKNISFKTYIYPPTKYIKEYYSIIYKFL